MCLVQHRGSIPSSRSTSNRPRILSRPIPSSALDLGVWGSSGSPSLLPLLRLQIANTAPPSGKRLGAVAARHNGDGIGGWLGQATSPRTGRTIRARVASINRSVDSKTLHSNDHFSVPALHTYLQEQRQTGGSVMFTEKPPLISEKVLFMVAGPMAVVLAIAAPVMAIF
jgi:hypothetical protein